MNANEQVHRFEAAGLGVAPFRLVGVERRTYQACHGAPVQPGGSCDYCGTGIVECCVIQDATGKRFVVGNDCVRHTSDRGLIDPAAKALSKVRREASHSRDDEKIAEGVAWARANADALAAVQIGRRTMLDRFDWMMQNAGRAGKLRVIREAKAAHEKYLTARPMVSA